MVGFEKLKRKAALWSRNPSLLCTRLRGAMAVGQASVPGAEVTAVDEAVAATGQLTAQGREVITPTVTQIPTCSL